MQAVIKTNVRFARRGLSPKLGRHVVQIVSVDERRIQIAIAGDGRARKHYAVQSRRERDVLEARRHAPEEERNVVRRDGRQVPIVRDKQGG